MSSTLGDSSLFNTNGNDNLFGTTGTTSSFNDFGSKVSSVVPLNFYNLIVLSLNLLF